MRAISLAKVLELQTRQDAHVDGVTVGEIVRETEAMVEELCWNESRLLGFLELCQRDEEWTDEEIRRVVGIMTRDGFGEGDRVMDQVRDWILEEARRLIVNG